MNFNWCHYYSSNTDGFFPFLSWPTLIVQVTKHTPLCGQLILVNEEYQNWFQVLRQTTFAIVFAIIICTLFFSSLLLFLIIAFSNLFTHSLIPVHHNLSHLLNCPLCVGWKFCLLINWFKFSMPHVLYIVSPYCYHPISLEVMHEERNLLAIYHEQQWHCTSESINFVICSVVQVQYWCHFTS